jgi:addiction module HigA family antidote
METEMILPKNRAPSHPGELIIRGFMIPEDITASALADDMDIQVDELRQLLDAEIPCTERLAERLAIALGTQASFWMSVQGIYDAWLRREGLYEDYHLAAN